MSVELCDCEMDERGDMSYCYEHLPSKYKNMSQLNDTRETDEVVDLEEQEFLAQLGRDEEEQEREMQKQDAIREALNHGANPFSYA